jgi:FkbM family methyltransferase
MDYEQGIENFYRSILRPGDTAIDCGAHSGRHAIEMAGMVGAAGRVFAFEPLPHIFSQLVANVATAGLRNVVAENVALGSEAARVPFVHVLASPGYSGFQERTYPDDSWTREIVTVDVRRLDDALPAARPAYIKIDVEGGDLLVLRGAAGTIARSRPFVTFELGDNSLTDYAYTAADYFDFFAERDYDLFSIDRDGLVESSRHQAVWDYVACPREVRMSEAALRARCAGPPLGSG